MKNKYSITGMTCSACVSRVEKAAIKAGATDINVNLLSNTMTASGNTDKIINQIIKSGYGCKLYENKPLGSKKELTWMKNRLIISVVLLIPLMYLSMAHMLHYSVVKPFDDMNINVIAQMIISLIIAVVNAKYFTSGFKHLFVLSPNMDSLIAVGSGASLIYAIISLFVFNKHNLYFESAAMILTLIDIGKYLEVKSKGKTRNAIKKLMDLTPDTAIIIKNNEEITININDLKIGDIIVIKPGMSIPVDGIIIDGVGYLDQSVITGESIPVELSVNDTVTSGTINTNSTFKFKATAVGEETAISNIIRMVENASASKAPIARLADKVASVFVPVVMSISLLAFVIWLIVNKDFEFAFSIGISVLVISCPCALGLATPVAIMVATGKGAQNGILFKDATSLERLGKIDTVVLDKTGTITNGKPIVTDVVSTTHEFLDIAYTLENLSNHPLANSIVDYCIDNNAELISNINNFQYIIGQGIMATINNDEYKAGNKKLTNITLDDYSKYGKTPIFFTKNNELIGVIAVADTVRESSLEAINDMSIDTIMITGDNDLVAKFIKDKVNVDNYIANALPNDKATKISQLQSDGKIVAMVGDGINDSPALTCSDVGIAIGAGSDVAIESADVVLSKNNLGDFVNGYNLSKATIKNIKENLFWAFFYNCLGIPLAAGVFYPLFGWTLNPMIAAAAMSFSSVTVVLNALRLNNFKFKKYKIEVNSLEIKNKGVKKQMKTKINIEGMMCQHCAKSVSDALMSINDINDVQIDLENNCAYVQSTNIIDSDLVKKVIEDKDYKFISME